MTPSTFIVLVFYCVKTVTSAACYSVVYPAFFTTEVLCEEEKKNQRENVTRWAKSSGSEVYGLTVACVPMAIIPLEVGAD